MRLPVLCCALLCPVQTYILFRAELAAPYTFSAGAESLEVALFEPDSIPFDEVRRPQSPPLRGGKSSAQAQWGRWLQEHHPRMLITLLTGMLSTPALPASTTYPGHLKHA